jgi:CDP-6-deoxy-D-xylo-4-hexulose-3-dehydrase
MDSTERNEMISMLAKDLPRYAYNCKEFIPGKSQVLYSGPYWDHRELEMAMHALLRGKWLTTGEYVYRFQNTFAKIFNVNFAHMVNSGSSANLTLITALKKYFKWNDGDEVIVSPVGFPTTIAPLSQNNLTPVFVDIEMSTLNFDLNLIESKITNKTRAIFVSPVLGNPPDIDVLLDLCKKHGIMLIGDNCDSLGSKWRGKYLNQMYYAWTTSFYPAHHITTGEGGMVCSDNEELMKVVRSISWWGRDCHCIGQANLLSCGTCGTRFSKWLESEGVDVVMDHKYLFSNMGYNLKPLDLQGAIGLAQLEKWPEIDHKRKENFSILKKIINDTWPWEVDVRVATQHDEADPAWFGVPIITKTPELKQSLIDHLESNKIQTRNYFAGNILLHPGYRHLDDAKKYPNANLALSNVFFIGCPPHYNSQVLNYIKEVICQFRHI